MSSKNHRDRGLRSEAKTIDDTNAWIESKEELIENVEEPDERSTENGNEVSATTFGVTHNCTTLNVRESADKDSESLCVVKSGTKLMVDLSKSTDDWYHVYTPEGAEGFCMKKFVSLKIVKR